MWKWIPFRRRFWIIVDEYNPKDICVTKARFGFTAHTCIKRILDGPFDTQEDAVRALSFWKLQNTKVGRVRNDSN